MSIIINYKLHGYMDSIIVFNKDIAASTISSLIKRGATDIGLDCPNGSDVSELREVIEKLSMYETLELIEEFKRFIAKIA